MKQTFLLLLSFSMFSCKNNSLSANESGWELVQVIKYVNSLDKSGRVVEAKEIMLVYYNGQEIGNNLSGITYYDYNSTGNLISERHFNIEDGNKILSSEIINHYNEKGLTKAQVYKRNGLLKDSIIKSYDEAGKLKIEAIISIKNRSDNHRDAAGLLVQRAINYDTNFLYHVYNERGMLTMQKLLNSNSKELSTNHYNYIDNELEGTYRISSNNDTLDKQFYERENDGTLKETSLIFGQDFTSTIWKKGDKITKELSLGTGFRSMRQYIYDKDGNLIEERLYY